MLLYIFFAATGESAGVGAGDTVTADKIGSEEGGAEGNQGVSNGDN